jgi:hypothetical protein
MAAFPSAVDRNRSNIGFGNYFGISVKTFVVSMQNMLNFFTMCDFSIIKFYI